MIKIGVIGAGKMGTTHIKLLKELKQFEVVGFYDPDNETLKKIADEFCIQPHLSMDTLLDSADAMDIVSPTLTHFECASRAIKKCKHVFIEKPLTQTIKDAKKLMALAHEADVKVQVGHIDRFNPAFLAAAEHLNDPLFIECRRLLEFDQNNANLSVIFDLMLNDIDLVMSVVKGNIKRISANGVAVAGKTPDIVNARIEFDNGCVANLTASRISLQKVIKTRIFQKGTSLSINLLEKRSDMVRHASVAGENSPLALRVDLANINESGNNPLASNGFEHYYSLKAELESFANAITFNSSPIVSIEDGLKTLEVAYMIHDKLKHTSHLPEISDIVQ